MASNVKTTMIEGPTKYGASKITGKKKKKSKTPKLTGMGGSAQSAIKERQARDKKYMDEIM